MSYLTLSLVALVLLAVVVGMLLVVLLELRRSLRQVASQLTATSEEARRAFGEAEQAARRINRIGRVLEGDAELERLAASVRESAQALGALNRMLRTATAAGSVVGPAVAAFVKVMSDRTPEPGASSAGAEQAPDAGDEPSENRGGKVSAA